MDEKYDNANGSDTPGLNRTRSRRFHAKSGKSDKRDSVDLESGGSKFMTPTAAAGAAPGASTSSRFGFFASDKYRTLTPIRRHKQPQSGLFAKDADSGRPSPALGKSSRRLGQSPQAGSGGMTIGAPSGSNAGGLSGSNLQPSFDDGDDEDVALPLFSPRTAARAQKPEDSIFRNSIGFNTDVSISQYWSRAIGMDSPKNKRQSKRLDSRSLK